MYAYITRPEGIYLQGQDGWDDAFIPTPEEAGQACEGHTFMPDENQWEPCLTHEYECPNTEMVGSL